MSAPKAIAPKPPTAKEIKEANVVETGKPIPAAALAQAVDTPEAAKLASSRAFEIEDDIPLPTKRIGQKGESIYPFATIGENQSFFVASSPSMAEPWKTLTSMASRMSRDLHPKKFVTARQTKNGTEGVRVWRGADSDQPLAPPRAKKSKAALEQEAIDGDTSIKEQPEPDFE